MEVDTGTDASSILKTTVHSTYLTTEWMQHTCKFKVDPQVVNHYEALIKSRLRGKVFSVHSSEHKPGHMVVDLRKDIPYADAQAACSMIQAILSEDGRTFFRTRNGNLTWQIWSLICLKDQLRTTSNRRCYLCKRCTGESTEFVQPYPGHSPWPIGDSDIRVPSICCTVIVGHLH